MQFLLSLENKRATELLETYAAYNVPETIEREEGLFLPHNPPICWHWNQNVESEF